MKNASPRRSSLRLAALALLLAWLLRELQWLRRWRRYWSELHRLMRSPALTTAASVPLSLDKLSLLSDGQFVSVVSGLLLGAKLRRTPSFALQLHRGLGYLANRRHPSQTCLAETAPHIDRLHAATTAEQLPLPLCERHGATVTAAASPDEPSEFAQGPAVFPLPWAVCKVAQCIRPLASAASLPRHAAGAPPWQASLESAGVTVLWREASEPGSTPWLLLHGIGGVDRRCVEGLVRRCRALDGALLAMPVHPNWEGYGTVPPCWAAATDAAEAATTTEAEAATFVTTRLFVRIVGEALARRGVRRVHVLAWSLGTCCATMLRDECPQLELRRVVFVDPAAALPLANSAWGWLLEPRPLRALREFRERSHRLGLGAWVVGRVVGTDAGVGALDADAAGDGGGGGGALTRLAAASLDWVGAALVAVACRVDHLRVAPELHPCAHGCDLEGALLNRPTTLLLLDANDTFLCPREHAAYLAEHCAEATVRWRAGWHCGWMYDRLWLEAGRGLGEAIDAFVPREEKLVLVPPV